MLRLVVRETTLRIPMLRWSLIFFLVAIVAAIFGFGQIAAGAQAIAVWLFWIFIIVFLITLIAGLIQRRR